MQFLTNQNYRWWSGGAALLLSFIGAVSARVFAGVLQSEMVGLQVFGETPSLGTMLVLMVLPLATLSLPLNHRNLTMALLPVLLNLPFQFFSVNVFSATIYAISMGWACCRLTVSLPHSLPRANIILPLLLLIATAISCILAFYASDLAWRKMWLTASDWGTYIEGCRNTWQGQWLITDWPHRGFSGGHFMPGFMMLFAPLFGTLPYVQTAFAVNSLLLFGSAGLIYYCARGWRLPPSYAAVCALIYLLYPSVSNMNLCVFYGFNGLYLFIPFFILFYWFYSVKRYVPALLLLIFLLSIRETVGIFFIGFGLVTFLGGDRKFGACCALLGGIYFIVAQRFLIPWFSGSEYIFYSQFSALGDSTWEIVLSPLLRPGAFWGQLLTWKNLLFLLLLLAPVFPAGWGRPWLWASGAVILLFTFLRGSAELVNISQQYQTENVIYLALLALYGIKCPPLWWIKVLHWPDFPKSRRIQRLTLASGTICCAIILHYFFAQTFYGANTLKILDKYNDVRTDIAEIEKLLPAGASVWSTERSAAQLLLRNRLSLSKRSDTEYAFYDINDGLADNTALHRAVISDAEFAPIWIRSNGTHLFYLFKRNAAILPRQPLRVMNEDEFARLGQLQPTENLASIRIKGKQVPQGILLAIAVKKAAVNNKFMLIQITSSGNSNSEKKTLLFDHGLTLPEQIPANAVFQTELIVPPWVQSVKFSLKEL